MSWLRLRLQGALRPGEEQADIARHPARIVDDAGTKAETAGFQVGLPVFVDLTNARRQGCQPFRLVRPRGEFCLAWLVDRRGTSVDDRPAAVRAETARKRRDHQLGLTPLEGSPDPVEAGVDDRIGQLKVVQTLPEFGELLFLALLQVLRRFLVVAAASITLGEERADR